MIIFLNGKWPFLVRNFYLNFKTPYYWYNIPWSRMYELSCSISLQMFYFGSRRECYQGRTVLPQKICVKTQKIYVLPPKIHFFHFLSKNSKNFGKISLKHKKEFVIPQKFSVLPQKFINIKS
jgi:hypothetical protein